MIHTFVPSQRVVGHFAATELAEVLLAERGFYAASPAFAREHGGPVTAQLLDAVPVWYHEAADRAGLQLNIDVRVHQLEPGESPATPGWHCDAAQREVAFDAASPTTKVKASLVGTVSSVPGGVSNTIFAAEPVHVDSELTPGHQDLWPLLDATVRTAQPMTVRSHDGDWTLFDPETPHTAEPARVAGVRLFARISLWNPPPGHRPGLTRTEQVYRLTSYA